MTSPSAASPTDTPVRIELEFVRAEQADDPFAFRFAAQTYLVRGEQGAYETVELRWTEALLRDLDQVRRPGRDPATVARVGQTLRELLDPAGWAVHEATIAEARTQRRRVHVTIRSAAAELFALPWELLSLRSDGQHLGALEHVLLRYAWPGTSTAIPDPAHAKTPGRLLLAWSAVGGAVPAAEQIKAAEEAAQAHGRPDVVEILANASYGTIDDALRSAEAQGRPFGALHLLCHGGEVGSTFGLALDAEGDGRPAVVDAGRLQQLLAPHADVLRVVVVSACDGGNMGQPGNRIGSVAQRLHRAGLRYVIASRYPLSTRGSTRMTGALYQALLAGRSVEDAFIEARDAAAREVAQLDWASLQLYARPEDGDDGRVLAERVEADAADTTAPAPSQRAHDNAEETPSEGTEPEPAKTKPAEPEPAKTKPAKPEPEPEPEPAKTKPAEPVTGAPATSPWGKRLAIAAVIVLVGFVGLLLIPDDAPEDAEASSHVAAHSGPQGTPAGDGGDGSTKPECATDVVTVPIGVQPVDLIMVVDDSASMQGDLPGVQDSINALVTTLADADLDPHLVLLSGSPKDQAAGICVPPPLGRGGCPAADANPPRYSRVDQRVSDTDALERLVHDYREYEAALRYGAAVDLVVVTRGNAQWTADYFTDQLTALDPYFETFVLHAIIGPKGTTYRELAMQTHGRLADVGGDYSRTFDGLADRIISATGLACEHAVPHLPGDRDFDVDRVNLTLSIPPDPPLALPRVAIPDACDDVVDGWFYDDPRDPRTIALCDRTCDKLHGDRASLEVTFGCETTTAR